MKQMIKIFSALNILLILSSACASAQDMKQSFLSIHLGAAFPTGDYGSTNQYSEKSGYAETGFSGSLKFTKMLSYQLGIGIAVHSDINSLNTSELQVQFQQQLPGYFAVISADPWSSTSFLVGAEYLEPISSASPSVFNISLMIGYMSATFPATTISFSANNGSGFISYPARDAGTFAFLFGTGFYLGVSEKISIPITIDYLGGTPHFDRTTANTAGGPVILEAYDQPISNFNLMTGIVIRLN